MTRRRRSRWRDFPSSSQRQCQQSRTQREDSPVRRYETTGFAVVEPMREDPLPLNQVVSPQERAEITPADFLGSKLLRIKIFHLHEDHDAGRTVFDSRPGSTSIPLNPEELNISIETVFRSSFDRNQYPTLWLRYNRGTFERCSIELFSALFATFRKQINSEYVKKEDGSAVEAVVLVTQCGKRGEFTHRPYELGKRFCGTASPDGKTMGDGFYSLGGEAVYGQSRT